MPQRPRAEPRDGMSTPSWAHLVAGASGGLATAILTCPLDVLRTRLQSDFYRRALLPQHLPATPKLPKAYFPPSETGSWSVVRSIAATEGWRGFFRGLGPSLVGVAPATAVKFYVYGNAKRMSARALDTSTDAAIVHALAAVMAGIVTATTTNPIWLIKTRLQLDKQAADHQGRQYKNSLDCVRQVWRQEGIRGFYRGLTASYLGTTETVAHLVLYEQLKLVSKRAIGDGMSEELANWVSTTGASAVAKIGAVLLTYPHEVVRTRLRQAPSGYGVPRYTGLVQSFRSVWVHEGMAGLYGGLTPHLLRSIPSAVITLGVYEFVLRVLYVNPKMYK